MNLSVQGYPGSQCHSRPNYAHIKVWSDTTGLGENFYIWCKSAFQPKNVIIFLFKYTYLFIVFVSILKDINMGC